MKNTILASALLSVLTIAYSNALITSGGATILNLGTTTCSDALARCSFSGTCCSLTDLNGGQGCTLTILGGTCSPSGSDCPFSFSATSTSSDACPVGDYEAVAKNEPTTAPPTGTSASANFGIHGFQYVAGFLVTSLLYFNYAI